VQATIRIHEDVETMGKTLYERAVEEGREKGRKEGVEKGREEGVAKGREEGVAKGREEGRYEGQARGQAEGRAAVLLRQLGKRFGALPAEVTARIRAADTDTLDLWAERVLDAKSLGDVFA